MHIKNLPFDERKQESTRILTKYPGKIPVIIFKHQNASSTFIQDIKKNKYILPLDYTVGQWLYIIRKNIELDASQALFLYAKGNLLCSSDLISNIYSKHKDPDGFLYMIYSAENTFG